MVDKTCAEVAEAPGRLGRPGPWAVLRCRTVHCLPLATALLVGAYLVLDGARNLSAGIHNPGLVSGPRAGDTPDDEASLRERIDRAPGVAVFHARLGALLFARGDYAGALASYDRAASLNPLNAQVQRERGLILHRLGRTAEADAAMERAARLNRSNGDLQFKVGQYFLLLRAFPPQRGPVVVDEATIQARRRALKLAGRAFRRASTLDSAYLDGALRYYQDLGLPAEQVEAVVPDTTAGWTHFARVLAKRGAWDDAVRVWRRVMDQASPVEAQWRLEAARALLGTGDGAAAEREILAAASEGKLTSEQVAYVARIYRERKRYLEGIQALNALRSHVRAESTRIYTHLGKLWWDMGKLSSAGLMFEKSALESNDPEAYYHLARIKELAGDPYAAERYYRQAIRADRENPRYRYRLGLLYFGEQRVSEAITEIEEAIRLAPGVREYRKKLTEIMGEGKSG